MFMLVLLGCDPGAATGREQPATWKPVSLAAAPASQASELRSPTVAHETLVEAGGSFAIDRWTVTFAEREDDKSVAWTSTKPGASNALSGRLTLPGLLQLPETFGARYPLWVRVAPSRGALLVGSAYGRTLPLAKGRGLLVDSDRDGVFGSKGDGCVAPKSRTVGPWCGEAWTANGGKQFRKTSGGAWEGATVTLPHPRNKDHCAAWNLLQWRRQQCGVRPVAYDKALEAAMRKHAEYAAHYRLQTHEEDPKRPLYSPEGDRAGRNSIIGWGDTSMLSALEMHFATLFHRTRPLQPGLTHTAIVFHQGIFMLNVFERRGGPLKDAILVYPPHGMEDAPTKFHPQGEHPMPVPGKPGNLGTAINVFSEPLRLAPSLSSVPTLSVIPRRKKNSVEGHFHYPGNPPNAKVAASNRGIVALIPSAPLRAKTDYACRVEIPMPGGKTFAYRWTFKTGGK